MLLAMRPMICSTVLSATLLPLLAQPGVCQEEPAGIGCATTEHERRSTRWWTWDAGIAKPVQIAINFDPAAIPAESGPFAGGQKRYAPEGSWVVFDNFRAVRVGTTRIPSGRWYLAVERVGEGQPRLLFMAAAAVHAHRLTPGDVAQAPVARSIPATVLDEASFAKNFDVRMDQRVRDKFRLVMRFGRYAIAVPMQVELDPMSGAGVAEAARLRVSGGNTSRKSLRAAVTDAGKRVGTVQLSYNPVQWVGRPGQESRKLEDMTGRSWRLGKNFWTVLTTDVPLRVGAAEIPIGVWYVGVHRSRDAKTWQLSLHDPARVRELLLDSNWISVAPATMRLALEYEPAESVRDPLRIGLRGAGDALALEIAWGPHRLRQTLRAVPRLAAEYPEYWALSWRGSQALRNSYHDEAIGIFTTLAAAHPGRASTCYYNCACAQSLKGDLDAAFASLRRAIDAGFTNFAHMKADSDLVAVRADPRFAKLLAGIRDE